MQLYTGRFMFISFHCQFFLFERVSIVLTIFECRVQNIGYGLGEIAWEDVLYYGMYLLMELTILF
jgi:hypothetical protein